MHRQCAIELCWEAAGVWLPDVSTIGISAHVLSKQERTQQAACQDNTLISCEFVLYPVPLAGRGCVTNQVLKCWQQRPDVALALAVYCIGYVFTGVWTASATKRTSE